MSYIIIHSTGYKLTAGYRGADILFGVYSAHLVCI